MIVVGGGVAGLAAAIMLRSIGVAVDVYEQSDAIREIGAGIMLTPNAVRILDRMGLDEEIRGRACAATAHAFLRWKDGARIIWDEYSPEFAARFGSASLSIHRGELVGILGRALPPEHVHLGHRFVGASQDDREVAVRFDNGEVAVGSMLLGADGIKSSVAAQLGIPTAPRSSGLAAYRGLLPSEVVANLDIEPAWTATIGPGGHFVHYYVSTGELLNFVAIVPSDAGEESWTTEGDVRDARAFYSGWHDQVEGILARVERVTLWGLFDRPARTEWGMGRVALIGDAAHPMLPTFAQGAAQSFEDGAVLARLVDSGSMDIPEILRAYTGIRLPRVRKIQDLAKRNSELFHLPDGPEQEARDARFSTARGDDPWRNNAWVYEYDPVPHVDEYLKNHEPWRRHG